MHTPFVDKSRHRRDGVGAGGWLKQRLAQILVRSSCNTNTNTTTTTTTTTSATAFVSLDKTNAADTHQEPTPPPSSYFCAPCTYQRPKLDGANRPRRRRRSASLVHISIDCTGGAGATSGHRSVHSDAQLLLHSSSLPTKDGRKQSRARRKPRSPSTSRRLCPSSSWGLARLPRRAPGQYSSSSSTVTDDELAPFSTDEEGGEEAETRTLFSSLSFSTDSTSEFYHTNSSSLARKGHKNAPRCPPPRRASTRTTSNPADAFRPVVAATKQHNDYRNDRKEEKKVIKKQLGADDTGADVGAGMAVVKRSNNPYADFRSSMVEMVVERRICSVPAMEELLGSYLSLNSPQHHPAILAAFEDVWEAVFGEE